MVLTHKYFNGVVPALGEVTEYDRETLAELSKVRESLEYNIENYHFREALKDAMGVARLGNKYLADTEPWKVVKTDPERVKTILNIAQCLVKLFNSLSQWELLNIAIIFSRMRLALNVLI